MKRFFLLTTCALSIAGCGGPPTTPNQNIIQEDILHEAKIDAPTIKVYMENSGSMDGYITGPTDFENAIYSYLSDIQYADIGIKADSTLAKNTLILNYINSEVLQQKPDVQEFIQALEPTVFKIKGGKRGTSDISNIMDTIISQTKNQDVSIFISDCIFSPGKKYKAKDNADDYIVAQQIGIKRHIVEKLAQNPDFAIVIMRLTSQFNGIYYNKFDEKQKINDTRPFFIWLLGDRGHLKNILNRVDLKQIKGKGVENIFMISMPSGEFSYDVSFPQPGNGKYKKVTNTTIANAKVEGKGGNGRFQVGIDVDFSKLLLSEEYLTDPNNYTISNKAYGLEIVKYSGAKKNKFTHTIKLTLLQPFISKGTIKLSLKNILPVWVNEYTDESGLDIKSPGAMEKTYGLKYLLEGVYDAYSANIQYGSITLNIK